jgi:Ca2+-binding RTX toxin-like protein
VPSSRTLARHLTAAVVTLSVLPPAGTATAQAATCGGLTPTLEGTSGHDNLVGSRKRDVVAGLGGDDTIRANRGQDVICGGPGDDRLVGGGDGDRIYGGNGDDRLIGLTGRDRLYGGGGNDVGFGDTGRDRLYGGTGRDTLAGGSGNDRLVGGPGFSDRCLGGDGTDGGIECEIHQSIALLAPQPVNFFRFPERGSSLCRFNLVVFNDGDEAATDVVVEGEVKTLAEPGSISAKPLLNGPDDIAGNGLGVYFFILNFAQGDRLQYVVRIHNGGTSIDTIRAPAGIVCTA